jgi:hypothetical protein
MPGGILRLVAALALAAALSASVAQADVGVGVDLTQVEVTEVLEPGAGYQLPGVGVINTGDEAADYEVLVSYVEGQAEERPSAAWFDFSPRRFHLEPGDAQQVDVALDLPAGATPGHYAALLEAHPVVDAEGVSVGVAAATRLSFTVEPTGWFAAQRLRISRFLRDLEPWTYVVEGTLLVAVAGYLIVRYSPYKLVRKR